ncbi:MAG: hypothetical protein AB1611_07320 [bacterium]
MAYERPSIEALGDAQMGEVMGAWAFALVFVPFLSFTWPFGTGGVGIYLVL